MPIDFEVLLTDSGSYGIYSITQMFHPINFETSALNDSKIAFNTTRSKVNSVTMP